MDQLEIISPTGDVEFYNLDPTKGVSNIGRHPENDIVIDHPDIAYFHAVLDHREAPYNIVVLSDEQSTMMNGEAVGQNVATPFRGWDTLQMAGFTLIVVNQEAPPPPPTPSETRPTVITQQPSLPPPAYMAASTAPLGLFGSRRQSPTYAGGQPPTSPGGQPPPESGPSLAVGQFPSLPPSLESNIIITEISETEFEVGVEQYVTFDLTITNGGDLVAAFDVQVVGLNPNWVTISSPHLNLNEGARTTVTVTITPPRHPSSRAGVHFFAVNITSPTYPDTLSQHGATLIVQPYYEFMVGELKPKQQSISFLTRSGQTQISIFNRGNSKANFRIEADDDERACSFELSVPGEAVSMARQAELTLLPEQRKTIPIRITPFNRMMIGARSRAYSFTVTTSLMGEQLSTPRSVLGRLTDSPLVGPWIITLMMLLMLCMCVFLLKPRSYMFVDAESETMSKAVRSGTPVTLYWEGSWFADWNIEPQIGNVTEPVGTVTVIPQQDETVYTFKVENFLSNVPLLGARDRTITVYVTPVFPSIDFSVDRTTIVRGESVTLFIDVQEANTVVLRTEEGPTELSPAEYIQAIRRESPAQTTNYQLVASNDDGIRDEVRIITVVEPTSTPIPTPQGGFSTDATTVAAGEPVNLSWAFPDADYVILEPYGIQLPAVGNYNDTPLEDTTYVLRAEKAGTEPFISDPVQVFVDPPTPTATATPEPLAPIIDFFTISDSEIVRGDSTSNDNNTVNEITLAWDVSGETTNIQLSGSPNFDPLDNLATQGNLTLAREESTTFILTAFNGEDKKTSQTLQLTVLEPTETPEPTPTETPQPTATATATRFPTPVIRTFLLESTSTGTDEVSQVGQGDNSRTYEVLVGSRVRLRWVVENASTVESSGTSDYQGGSEPLSSEVEFVAQTEGRYTLTAYDQNATNATNVLATVVIELRSRDIPPPSDVSGTEHPSEPRVNLLWQFPSDDDTYLLGFRIYRADVSDNDFRLIASEADLGSSTLSWDDTSLEKVCDKVYYLTSVYLNPSDNSVEETDSSSNSWYTEPCN